MDSTCTRINQYEISIPLIKPFDSNYLVKNITDFLNESESLTDVNNINGDGMSTIYFSRKKEKHKWIPESLWNIGEWWFGSFKKYNGKISFEKDKKYDELILQVAKIYFGPYSGNLNSFLNQEPVGTKKVTPVEKEGIILKFGDYGGLRPLSEEDFQETLDLSEGLKKHLTQ